MVEGGIGSDLKMKKGALIRRQIINLKGSRSEPSMFDLEISLEGRTRRLPIF